MNLNIIYEKRCENCENLAVQGRWNDDFDCISYKCEVRNIEMTCLHRCCSSYKGYGTIENELMSIMCNHLKEKETQNEIM